MNLPMHWQDKGKRDRPKLVTYSKEINGKTPNKVLYAVFEAAFLTFLNHLDWTTIIDASDSSEIRKAEEEIAALDLTIAREENRLQTIVDALIDLPSPALKARLAATESALEGHKKARKETAARLASARSKQRDLLDVEKAYHHLAGARDLETRSKLRAEIRRKVERITLWFYRDRKSPRLVKDRSNEIFPFAQIRFTNGKERYIVFFEEDLEKRFFSPFTWD